MIEECVWVGDVVFWSLLHLPAAGFVVEGCGEFKGIIALIVG